MSVRNGVGVVPSYCWFSLTSRRFTAFKYARTLASIRLLVDTLLDEPSFDQQRVREYLELVAKENQRLSRLIGNFLAFSRMERNKHAFEFAEVRAAKVIDAAVEALARGSDAD